MREFFWFQNLIPLCNLWSESDRQCADEVMPKFHLFIDFDAIPFLQRRLQAVPLLGEQRAHHAQQGGQEGHGALRGGQSGSLGVHLDFKSENVHFLGKISVSFKSGSSQCTLFLLMLWLLKVAERQPSDPVCQGRVVGHWEDNLVLWLREEEAAAAALQPQHYLHREGSGGNYRNNK